MCLTIKIYVLSAVILGLYLPPKCLTRQTLTGYYAFERASKTHGIPPRVRKPPYVPANVPCPGAVKSTFRSSPKDTLCGDLNRGYVPINPMGLNVDNQPYPFEIIKNKTLHFLARALPYLKEDIKNIPKVGKLNPTVHFHGSDNFPLAESVSPEKKQLNKDNNKFDARYFHYHGIGKRAVDAHQKRRQSDQYINARVPVTAGMKNVTKSEHTMSTSTKISDNDKSNNKNAPKNDSLSRKEAKFYNGLNLTEARQKVCEQNQGMGSLK